MIVIARIRVVALAAGLLVLLFGGILTLPFLVRLLFFVCCYALSFVGPRSKSATGIPVAPPVTGRWVALNSPGTKVPSHGLHTYGQTYAIDIVYEPRTASGLCSAGRR